HQESTAPDQPATHGADDPGHDAKEARAARCATRRRIGDDDVPASVIANDAPQAVAVVKASGIHVGREPLARVTAFEDMPALGELHRAGRSGRVTDAAAVAALASRWPVPLLLFAVRHGGGPPFASGSVGGRVAVDLAAGLAG